MTGTQRLMCIQRYLNPDTASWKYFLDFYLSQVGGKLLFHCNFNYSKLPISFPDVYKECIVSWASQNSINPSSLSEISNQFLWNNMFICIASCSVYNHKLTDAGLLTVRDLFDSNGNFKDLALNAF